MNAPFKPAASPAGFAESPLAQALRQPLMLGLFLPIQKGGWSPSALPRTTSWEFDYNLDLTRTAEALGFDLVFGLSQWMPKGYYGSALEYREDSLDPFITVAAMSRATERIILISTIHVLYGPWHPLHLAKFGATLDHISGGRWGVNIVTGFEPGEAQMFGKPQIPHDSRYEMADEFTCFMEELWAAQDNLTSEGRHWKLDNAFVSPKSRFARPILVNAAGSEAGLSFAARHSDIVFITSPAGADIDKALVALPDYIAGIKRRGRALGRDLKVLINPMIVCKATDAEAQQYYDDIAGAADEAALDAIMRRYGSADTKTWGAHDRARRAVGGNVQIIGSPETVANRLADLKAAGCDGVQIAFFDFAPDLAYFGETVLPALKTMGLRL
ncbi:LLM class flavin-dependent oxidoreductase [Bosea caraganae]|uniref:LLM class flavin-dependent oxidoreductase n=1 Tax=Bosea caraganae TaxID=2763117 RepID=A0A370L2H2_9HYPH|nr:LLM class flavin-dependent oxidoreductase [Bosea caraganae]RDJ22418.1 LLM class flavin-dependent oxidoreductase [Bosea caraganae]RDJ30377.1 LLM class flavin-dependent oxidoreductase [Bosea caraganae]